jgi:hypothetical protein
MNNKYLRLIMTIAIAVTIFGSLPGSSSTLLNLKLYYL